MNLEVVLILDERPRNIEEFINTFQCDNNIKLTIIEVAPSSLQTQTMLNKLKKSGVDFSQVLSQGGIWGDLNDRIKNSQAEYLFFCNSNTRSINRGFASLIFDYAKLFSSDIVCVGVGFERSAHRLSLIESVSESRYARESLMLGAALKGQLGLLCNKVYRSSFLREQTVGFKVDVKGELAALDFNIRAFLNAKQIQSTRSALVWFEEVCDVYKPASSEAIRAHMDFCKDMFQKYGKTLSQKLFLPLVLGLSKRIWSFEGADLKREILICLQELIEEPEVQKFLKEPDREFEFINHFADSTYLSQVAMYDFSDVYIANLFLFHILENENCLNEAFIHLLNFVYNKNNSLLLGKRYLEDLVSKSEVALEEYHFAIKNNLQESLANEEPEVIIKKVDALFQEGNDKNNFHLLLLLAMIFQVNKEHEQALKIFLETVFSSINTENVIPNSLLDSARLFWPIEHRVLKLFLEHDEWTSVWNRGNFDDYYKLAEEINALKDSCEKDILCARLCLKLGEYEEAASFYKSAIGTIRNDARYPINEAIFELTSCGREDLVKEFKKYI